MTPREPEERCALTVGTSLKIYQGSREDVEKMDTVSSKRMHEAHRNQDWQPAAAGANPAVKSFQGRKLKGNFLRE